MGAAVDLRERATDAEDLDVGVPEDEALGSLGDLRFVNRWLGGRSALRRAVRPHLEASLAPSLLDVGCGSGDVAAFLASTVSRPILAVGADLKLLHVRQVPREVTPIVADVHGLPFRERAFDVVLASLFLHHFDGDAPAAVLAKLYALCRRALVVTDLHRARVPYVFGRVTFPWLFRSRVSVNDGLLSIRRAFRPTELRAQFEAAGLSQVQIRRVFPYRLLAVAARPPSY
jgi:ubiquinone/menaquinone biosynthesis C-methylase UbiE